MTDYEMREILLNIINTRGGISSVDLGIAAMGFTGPCTLDAAQYIDMLQSLVKIGEIVRVQFAIPIIPCKIKTFYFPKGTVFVGVQTEDKGNKEVNTEETTLDRQSYSDIQLPLF